MKPKHIQRTGLIALLLGLCLVGTPEIFAQRTGGGGGGGGGGGRTGGGGGGGGSGASRSSTRTYYPNGMIGDATITSDPETHSIVVIADDETNLEISKVITNLDRPAPQVLIKVVFLEATHTDTSDLGLEGSYTHFPSGSTTGIVSTLFGAAQTGASGVTSGGFYQIMGANFSATLHALATAGKTEVLSRPSILARNNQLASITVGQSVPLITGTVISTLGTQNNTFQYSDIGILLRVTPFITSEGLVQMIISPEITSLTDQTVNMGPGVNVPVIAKRSADTVVVTPDGAPVVIGGLMQNQKIDSTTKVPILGDIPLLGLAFQRKQKNYQKTELIIILIPHIVYQPTQLAAMSDRERSKVGMAAKAFPEEELDRYLDTLPVKKDTVPNAKSASKKKNSSSSSNSTLASPNQRDN
jgi:general secretion pathway protein D